MDTIIGLIGILLVLGIPAIICGIFWRYEAGFRAYSKGRGYHDGEAGGFRLNEESEGIPGHRKIAWIPTKTKYGWVWLDYVWKGDKGGK